MTKRIVLLTTLILSLVLLPGCPGTVSAVAGTWIMTRGSEIIGLELMLNGSVTVFPAPASLSGTLTWELNGSELILRQENTISDLIYVGRVSGNSAISGGWVVWDGADLGIGGDWSAVKQ